MFNKRSFRWPVAIPIIVAVVEFAVIVCISIFRWPILSEGFDAKTVKPFDDFTYKNELTCTIVYSTHQAGHTGLIMPWFDNDSFTLAGLDSDKPSMTVNGKKWTDLQKVSETDGYLQLQIPPSVGSDTIGLMTDNGSFVRTITGIQAGMWEFHYAIAQKGRCE